MYACWALCWQKVRLGAPSPHVQDEDIDSALAEVAVMGFAADARGLLTMLEASPAAGASGSARAAPAAAAQLVGQPTSLAQRRQLLVPAPPLPLTSAVLHAAPRLAWAAS